MRTNNSSEPYAAEMSSFLSSLKASILTSMPSYPGLTEHGYAGIEHFLDCTADLLPRHLSLLFHASVSQTTDLRRKSDQADPLTHTRHEGVLDLSTMLCCLQQRIGADDRSRRQYAVLCIGLDNLDRITASLGTTARDEVLVEVARRLQQTVQSSQGNAIAYLSGHEFIVLMGDVQAEEDALTYARSLEYILRSPFALASQPVFLSACVGVLFGRFDVYSSPDEVLSDASLAMSHARRASKAPCVLFSPAMREETRARLKLEADLRQAVANEELQVFYQPKVRLDTGAVTGFEALARWHDPVRGWVPPVRFISVAEEVGLISEIGRWVTKQAVSQLSKWRLQELVDPVATMAVNVSPKQLEESDLFDWVTNQLKVSALPAECLVLEITENILMQESSGIEELLCKLTNIGIGLDLDDFGTGYSSLSYLRRFPFRSLKIDRSFVNQMTSQAQSINLVRSIINLAHSLEIKVIAEGVETAWQAQQLYSMGCAKAQGYFYSPPRPVAELKALLTQRRCILGESMSARAA